MMTVGVEIDALGDDEESAREISQYAFKDAEHFIKGSQECDRALVCGHLEEVPIHEVEWSLANGSVHPWTVVHQSADKWRSCQDYKGGTNGRVISSPFTLARFKLSTTAFCSFTRISCFSLVASTMALTSVSLENGLTFLPDGE